MDGAVKRIVFYVSGHGFGHAVRTAEVIRALLQGCPTCRVFVRTTAPARLFEHLPERSVQVDRLSLDTGVVENQNALIIDVAATVQKLLAFLGQREVLVDSEVEFLRREKIQLILADVPYLAGEIAYCTGVPCLAIANFTWDWIYEPYLVAGPQRDRVLMCIRNGYGQMVRLLRLPFHHETDAFREAVDVPLVVRRSRRSRAEIRRAMRLEPADRRRLVLLASRGPVSMGAVGKAARDGQDFVFVHWEPSAEALPENTRYVRFGPELGFSDVLSVCDFAVTKLGYGMLAECIANGTGLLFPPRDGFREDAMLRAGAAKHLRARELPPDDYESGCWVEWLRELDRMPAPQPMQRMDGAEQCADHILRLLM